MKTIVNFFFLTAMLLGLPLLGVGLAGHDIRQYAEFPPLTRYATHAAFSWPVFIGLAALLLLTLAPFVLRVLRRQAAGKPRAPGRRHPFPGWGRAGLIALAVFWILAWTRFAWFAPLQAFTFAPLWLAFIVTVSAVTQWRTGRCTLARRPGFFALLFPVSAGFWWFFEYLNRFVQNWVYENVEGLSALDYVVFATFPFATVLPAVLSVYELLRSFPRLTAGLNDWVAVRPQRPRALAWTGLAVAGLGLAGIGVWPNALFPLLWVSPLLVIVCLQTLRGRRTVFASLGRGDWRVPALWALSALVCGFFWELWNYHSLARWVYRIPFVDRFHLFEMPILGYAGYLPFGLQCAVVTAAVARRCARRRPPPVLRFAAARTGLALLIAAALWLPFMHLLYKPNLDRFRTASGVAPRAAALAARHIELWSAPASRRREIERMRHSNAEWDFMARTYTVLALSNMALREPARADEYLAIMDAMIDETMRIEEKRGMHYFLMDYARDGVFRNAARRSVFVDGEIALMLGARRMVREQKAYRALMNKRLQQIERQMRETPLLCAESYPDECWMFCNAVAMAAFRMAEALDGADHSALIDAWLRSVQKRLTDPATGLLVSSFTLDGRVLDGPEGSSLWMVAHCLQLVDTDFAADQYRRARRELARTVLGFGWSREWPTAWRSPADVDSGPVIPFLDISAGASGLAIVGAAAFDDRPYLTALLTSLEYGGFPVSENGRLRYCAGNAVGDAVILYAMVLGPLWEAVENRLLLPEPGLSLKP
jgi:hypothetical protein